MHFQSCKKATSPRKGNNWEPGYATKNRYQSGVSIHFWSHLRHQEAQPVKALGRKIVLPWFGWCNGLLWLSFIFVNFVCLCSLWYHQFFAILISPCRIVVVIRPDLLATSMDHHFRNPQNKGSWFARSQALVKRCMEKNTGTTMTEKWEILQLWCVEYKTHRGWKLFDGIDANHLKREQNYWVPNFQVRCWRLHGQMKGWQSGFIEHERKNRFF